MNICVTLPVKPRFIRTELSPQARVRLLTEQGFMEQRFIERTFGNGDRQGS